MKKDSPQKLLFFVLFLVLVLAIFFVLKAIGVHPYPEKDPYVIVRSDPQIEIPEVEDFDPKSIEETSADVDRDSTEIDNPVIDSLQQIEEDASVENAATAIKEPSEDAPGYFDQLVSDYRRDVMSQLPDKKNRTDIVVRYYDHQADQDRAEILSDYGFYLHKRPVDEELKQYPSNAIYYGDEVSTRDIQLIAYLLLQNGMDIKAIQMSKYHDSWKSQAVEIGTDIDLTNNPNLTLSEIMTFDK